MSENIVSEIFNSKLNRAIKCKFLCVFNLPECLRDLSLHYKNLNKKNGVDRDAVILSIEKVRIPKNTIRAELFKFGGGNVYLSSHTKEPFEPLEFKFKIDNYFLNYTTINNWLNFIYDEKENHFNGENLVKNPTFKDYNTNMKVIAMDEYNNEVYEWTFANAIPIDISGLDFSYQETDQLDCTASFYFSQMWTKNLILSNVKNIE